MTETGPLPSRILYAVITLSLSLACNALFADQAVITDGGREVLLRQDGSWQFRSTDRFASTANGKRVRLKADGSWQYIGNTPASSGEPAQAGEPGFRLQKVVIEKSEKKVQKNKRVRTRTVFYVKLELSPLANRNIRIDRNDVSLVSVTDNNGRNYSVLGIQPGIPILEPGSSTIIAVRADDSPGLLENAESMTLIFRPGIFGIQQAVRLSRQIDDFEAIDVKWFDTGE